MASKCLFLCPFHILLRVCVFVCVFLSFAFLWKCVRDAKDGAAVARLMWVIRVVARVAVRKRFSRVVNDLVRAFAREVGA